ncbi:hypothetical protein B7494_g6070 [Chlorociboria aeruginascens]|nr:hypothetical protein B7494_g6070 [Chlorociboria aeruginascens]
MSSQRNDAQKHKCDRSQHRECVDLTSNNENCAICPHVLKQGEAAAARAFIFKYCACVVCGECFLNYIPEEKHHAKPITELLWCPKYDHFEFGEQTVYELFGLECSICLDEVDDKIRFSTPCDVLDFPACDPIIDSSTRAQHQSAEKLRPTKTLVTKQSCDLPHTTTLIMKLRSTRIYHPLQPQLDLHQLIPAPNPHILGSCSESQTPREQRPADPQTEQSVGATSNPLVLTSAPIEAPALVPSRAQFHDLPHIRTTVQQPKPLPFKRPHASFLEDLVDQLPSNPAPKRSHLESVVTEWLESIPGSGSDRRKHCRSDTLLGHSNGEIIPRRLTKSAPNIASRQDADRSVIPPIPTQDADELVLPSTPTTTISPSRVTGSSTRRSLVEQHAYRYTNLAANNIYLRYFFETVPEDIANLLDHLARDRNSPGPSLDQVRQDTQLCELEMGSTEADVENYFKAHIFPDHEPGSSESLKRVDRLPMAKHAVPNNIGSKLRVSNPVPDMLYGYKYTAFPQQQAKLFAIGNEMEANSRGLIYPFFVIEFKGDIPGASGGMWAATNQCIGGSVSCVKILERLNGRLKQYQLINSAAFSLAITGTEARLYISWKHNEHDYYMQRVKCFALLDPEHYVEFRKHVLNIVDWGKGERFNEVREALDLAME